MNVDVEELRRDVREALENGRERVELIYADNADYNAALTAMRGDGWQVSANPFAALDHPDGVYAGGVIFVSLAQGAAL